MKKGFQIILFLFQIGVLSQDIHQMNQDLNLTDSLTFSSEVRVYQGQAITNYSSLFRMYQDDSNVWTIEFYEYFAKVEGIVDLKINKSTLASKSDSEFIFLSLIQNHILELPDESEIQWKLVKSSEIKKVKNKVKGKVIEEYEIYNEKNHIIDGEGYFFQVKWGDSLNNFKYGNPDGYLELFPENDELIYVCNLLKTIRVEFGIWE
jgi:hypothetical protein